VGFTLVETLVSLVILSVAMIPILNLTAGTARVNSNLQDNLVAAGLVQEGIEVVRAIRDNNWFNDRAFDEGLAAGVYQVQWDSNSLLSLPGNPVLFVDNGIYTYSGSVPSKFRRTVTISKPNAGELMVVGAVTWIERSNNTKTLSAESHLFNWK